MSAQPIAVRPRRPLRVLAVPDTEPPVVSPLPTDTRRLPPSADQPTLTLVEDAVAGHPPQPWEQQVLPTGDLPHPAGTARTLVRAVVEVLSGARPATQLIRWADHDVHAALTRRAAITARVRGTVPARRPPVVRGVRTCPVSDRVVEASAVVVEADRVRAVALRLEACAGRWRITALEVG